MQHRTAIRAAAMTIAMAGAFIALPGMANAATPTTISGTAWYDVDADGTKQASETGLAGVQVTLVDKATNTAVSAPVTTAADGAYSFSVATAGTYTVTFTAPTNYATNAAGSSVGASKDVVVDATSTEAPVNSGLIGQGVVSGTVFDDKNLNSTFESGEAVVADAKVELLDGAGNVASTATASAAGGYTLNNVGPGNYTLRVSATGFTTSSAVTVTETAKETQTKNVPLRRASGTVSGVAWLDVNKDGIQQGTETTLMPGVEVFIVQVGDSTPIETVTDANGRYSATVPWGDYTVAFLPPQGYAATDGPNSNEFAEVTVDGANFNAIANIGVAKQQLYPVTGTVWDDLNNNSSKDTNETAGVPGATVTLLDEVGEVVATVKTDAKGNYTFPGVPSGEYKLRFTPPSGYYPSGKTVAKPVEQKITVAANSVTKKQGMFKKGAISGTICWDANQNKKCDAAEKGIPGATFTFVGPSGTTTTTTDASGNYKVSDLIPGNYKATLTWPEKYAKQLANKGTLTATVPIVSGKTLDADGYLYISRNSASTGTGGGTTSNNSSGGSTNKTTSASATPQLAKTGSENLLGALTAFGLIGAGSVLVRRRYTA